MIREATIHDAPSIARILVNAWQGAYKGIIEPDYPKTLKAERFIDLFTNNIRKNIETIYVLEKENVPAGFISGKLISGKYDSEVIGLYVHPEYQGMGIGSELLDKMKSYFRSNACKTMIVRTLLNVKNNRFYEKHGGAWEEYKEIEIGNKNYQGVGFLFRL